jgi:hypothetical protein
MKTILTAIGLAATLTLGGCDDTTPTANSTLVEGYCNQIPVENRFMDCHTLAKSLSAEQNKWARVRQNFIMIDKTLGECPALDYLYWEYPAKLDEGRARAQYTKLCINGEKLDANGN